MKIKDGIRYILIGLAIGLLVIAAIAGLAAYDAYDAWVDDGNSSLRSYPPPV